MWLQRYSHLNRTKLKADDVYKNQKYFSKILNYSLLSNAHHSVFLICRVTF